MIGAGLYDDQDLTLRSVAILRQCSFIFLESYTSLYPGKQQLETLIGKPITLADRTVVEQQAETILDRAEQEDVALLIIGDVFAATTHTDLYLRAVARNIEIRVIPNASIMTAVGEVGLELYRYGRTASMVYFEDKFRPITPYTILKENNDRGLHTLMLVDIKADQQRYMTVQECLQQLLSLEAEHKQNVIDEQTVVVGVARLGSPDRKIVSGTVAQLRDIDFGAPPHSVIIPGKLHFVEEDMLALWKV